MGKGLIGRKIGMTQIYDDLGRAIPVTVIEAGPCVVVMKKTVERDGYKAIQLGFGEVVKEKKVNKPMKGYFAKNNVKPHRELKEFKFDDVDSYNSGDVLNVSIFKDMDKVDITGISISKGFQGVVKRHHFAVGPGGHGSMFHRRPGAIGCREFPGETIKGKRMAGRLGGKRVTTKSLKIVKIFEDRNLILVKGSVPGFSNSIVYIKENNSFAKTK
jgi:large subunit ribosomal protein L3